MAIRAGVAYIDILPNLKQFGASLTKEINAQQKEVASRVGRRGLILSAGVLLGAKKAISAASDLEEAMSAVTVTFGEASDEVLKWSKNTNDAFSAVKFDSAIKGYAVFGKAAGLANRENAKFSKGLVDAAQDLASFHNADPSEVLDNIKSGLTGEAEPLRKYGILISEVNVQNAAMTMGLAKQGEKLTESQKILARRELIMNSLGAAQGDWARTIGSAANQERLLAANTEDTVAALGQSLLPAYKSLISLTQGAVNFMGKHATLTKTLAVAVAAAAAGMLTYSAAVKVTIAAQMIYNTVFLRSNAVMAANPIGLVVVALAALAAALIYAYKKSDTFRAIVDETFRVAREAVVLAITIIVRQIDIYLFAIQKMAEVASHLPFIGDKFRGVADTIESVRHKMDSMVDTIDNLGKSSSKTGRELSGMAGEAKLAAASLEQANKALQKSLLLTQQKLLGLGTQVDAVFGDFAEKALRAFDAETSRVSDSLTQRVEKYGDSWMLDPDQKTPAERELEALDELEARRSAKMRRAQIKKDKKELTESANNRRKELQDELKELTKITDVEQEIGGRIFTFKSEPNTDRIKEIKGQLKTLNKETRESQQGLNEQLRQLDVEATRSRLEKKAAQERDAATEAQEQAAKNAAAAQETARRNYEALREIQREHLEKELTALQTSIAKGKLAQDEARKKALALLKEYGIDLKIAGENLGNAFSTALLGSLESVQAMAGKTHELLKKILAISKQIESVVKATLQAVKGSSGSGGGFNTMDKHVQMALFDLIKALSHSIPPRYDSKGNERHPTSARRHTSGIVGMFRGGLARSDTVPAMLTPGEMVLNKAQQAALGGTKWLKRVFGFAGGGIVPGDSETHPSSWLTHDIHRNLLHEIEAWAPREHTLAQRAARFALNAGTGIGGDPSLSSGFQDEFIIIARNSKGKLIGVGSYTLYDDVVQGDFVGGIKGGGLRVMKQILADAAAKNLPINFSARFDEQNESDAKLFDRLGIPTDGVEYYLEPEQVKLLNDNFMAMSRKGWIDPAHIPFSALETGMDRARDLVREALDPIFGLGSPVGFSTGWGSGGPMKGAPWWQMVRDSINKWDATKRQGWSALKRLEEGGYQYLKIGTNKGDWSKPEETAALAAIREENGQLVVAHMGGNAQGRKILFSELLKRAANNGLGLSYASGPVSDDFYKMLGMKPTSGRKNLSIEQILDLNSRAASDPHAMSEFFKLGEPARKKAAEEVAKYSKDMSEWLKGILGHPADLSKLTKAGEKGIFSDDESELLDMGKDFWEFLRSYLLESGIKSGWWTGSGEWWEGPGEWQDFHDKIMKGIKNNPGLSKMLIPKGKPGIFDPIPKKGKTGFYTPIPIKPKTGFYTPIPGKGKTGFFDPIPDKAKTGFYDPIPDKLPTIMWKEFLKRDTQRILDDFSKATDTVPAMLTPGELVLTKFQQGRLGAMLQKKGKKFDPLKLSTGGIVPGFSHGTAAFDFADVYDDGGAKIIGQYVQNQTVTDESMARQIGNTAARKVSRR